MNLQMILGAATFLTGVALVLIGTDYGQIFNVTVGVIVGGVFILLGINRLKRAWLNRNEE